MVLCLILEGKKPKTFSKFCKKNNYGFLALNTLVMENPQENLLMAIFQMD